MPSAILLVAHGSRKATANVDLIELANRFQERLPDEITEIGYLELTEPTIPDGLEKCVERGATHVAILPYFLSQGAHVTSDLVTFRDDFLQRHADVSCVVCPPIGLHPQVIEILLDRLKEGRSKDQSP